MKSLVAVKSTGNSIALQVACRDNLELRRLVPYPSDTAVDRCVNVCQSQLCNLPNLLFLVLNREFQEKLPLRRPEPGTENQNLTSRCKEPKFALDLGEGF